MTNRGSIDRENAVGYLIAKALVAKAYGNKEQCEAYTEAARFVERMPSTNGAGIIIGQGR